MGNSEHIERIQKIRGKLRKALKPERYEHSLSVSFTAVALAMRYGYDIRKAELAGLLHDCAKCFSKSELLHYIREHDLEMSEEMEKAPQVLHALVGAEYAREEYHESDPEILSAIRFHTLGQPAMTRLEEMIFVSDYIEARRDKAARLPELRKTAFLDLEEAVYQINHDTISYLETKHIYICKESCDTYSYYRELHEKKLKEK